MPKPLHVCAEPGCAELCAGTYCEQHARPERKRAPDNRAGSTARGYGYEWQKIRAAFLKAYPWCMAAGCTKPATDVDHVKPLAKGGTSDWENLASYCHSHHSKKTARYDKR